VRMPSEIVVRDAQGFELRMQTVAQQEIARDALNDSVQIMYGGAA
jgi:hypothetical protein